MQSQFDQLPDLYEDMADWPFRRFLEIPNFLAALGDLSDRDVLDFGCGNGMYSRLLKEKGARRVVGYDVSDGMLAFARARESEQPLGIDFTSDLEDDLAGQFDLVLAVYVLPYATTRDELRVMCEQMAKPLRPGGRLVTLPIHPDYVRDPAYYERFGFRLTPVGPDIDGGEVQLDLFGPDGAGSDEDTVTAYVWTRESIDEAMHAAGFAITQWIDYGRFRSAEADAKEELLRGYWERPHAAIVNCRLS
ncbi:class I SAM-dependent methyltransferase [Prescottella agglutinans]|uniref:Class I SAM-dependent methyltransferase n=1 Tax=Prescottella agglutinans TaxID=1644129 RepID=A0A438BAK1_9NOCA|nr:class I SAM-dependent methyltransferase [Prescottella agglutinans]RVW07972.1 class I SAM-dependent methyltransferase [Prescottella agglutinans]